MCSDPEDPADPVITTRDELRDALARRFLANANAGDDAANDALVTDLATWRRTWQQRKHNR